MFEAQYLFKDSLVFSPWFDRGGDTMRFTADVVSMTADARLRVQTYTKSAEDFGDGDLVNTFTTTAGALGRYADEASGLKDLVRYRFRTLKTGGNRGDRVLFRMLTTIWIDHVEA